MKVAEQIKTMKRSGDAADMEGKTFEIEANEVLFDALSNNIYTNKIQAVIRETACNAYDANVEAGLKDTPIKVYLPNAVEPSYKVTDNGPGLSEEDVYDLYTTYGKSTKRSSNEVIGCFGVGSKSPLAYADTFTVVSHHDGMSKSYLVFKDERNFPKVQKIGEEASSKTGMEVIVPVLNSDFGAFEVEAEFLFSFFNVKPVVVSSSYSVKDWDYKNTNTLGRFTLKEYDNHRQPRVIMGNVSYSIDIDAMNIDEDLKSRYKNLLSRGKIDIEVPLGYLSVSISRERLSYDKKTTRALQDMFEEMKKSLYIIYRKGLLQCASLETARDYYQHSSIRRNFFPCDPSHWQGLPVNNQDHLICKVNGLYSSFGFQVSPTSNDYNWKERDYDKDVEKSWHIVTTRGLEDSYSNASKIRDYYYNKRHYDKGYRPKEMIFFKKKPRDYKKRVLHLKKFEGVSAFNPFLYYVKDWEGTQAFFKKYFPECKLFLLDDVVPDASLKSKSSSYSLPKFMVWDFGTSNTDRWSYMDTLDPDEYEEEKDEYPYYVVYSRNKLQGDLCGYHSWRTLLKKYGKLGNSVIACPKSRIKEMEKDKTVTLLTRDVAKQIVKDNFPKEVIEYFKYKEVLNADIRTKLQKAETIWQTAKEKPIKNVDKYLDIARKMSVTYDNYKNDILHTQEFQEIGEELASDDHDLCTSTIDNLNKKLDILSHVCNVEGLTEQNAKTIYNLIK